MNLRYTNHATRRMAEMGLTGEDVQLAVDQAEVITPADRTADRYGQRTGDRTGATQYRRGQIAVVVSHDGAVITVLERKYDQYDRKTS